MHVLWKCRALDREALDCSPRRRRYLRFRPQRWCCKWLIVLHIRVSRSDAEPPDVVVVDSAMGTVARSFRMICQPGGRLMNHRINGKDYLFCVGNCVERFNNYAVCA